MGCLEVEEKTIISHTRKDVFGKEVGESGTR